MEAKRVQQTLLPNFIAGTLNVYEKL